MESLRVDSGISWQSTIKTERDQLRTELEFWPELVPRWAFVQSPLLRSSEASLSFLAK
jgi:hypothetical protein